MPATASPPRTWPPTAPTAPWYRTKRTVSVADMLAALRRALLAAQYQQAHPGPHALDLFLDLLLTRLDLRHNPETRGIKNRS
jgi:hypothetical protein